MNKEKPIAKCFAIARLLLLAPFTFFLFSCNEKEAFDTESLEDYMPMAVGKYITYRLDSLVFTNFGRTEETHPYQEKHIIEAEITDNLGRPSFRVHVYQRDSAGTQSWQPSNTYMVTPLADQLEVSYDNLRFIKLHLPIRDGYSWKGNKYLPTNPYDPMYNFSNDNSMQAWDYYYDGPPSSFSYENIDYNDVLTVEQADEEDNLPIDPSVFYAAKSRSVERYAKNTGLVFKHYELWEYQANTGNPGGPYKTGFGIKMWMIDHN